MIKIRYNKVCARCVQSEPLTSGMVGQTIQFEYSHDFDGLTVTAVFTNGKKTVDVLDPGAECVIPHEVLDTAGAAVSVGVYATKGADLVIPTVYAQIGVVLRGADPSGDVEADPTLPIWAQLKALMGDLSDLETEAKDTLVAAINEAAQTGGGAGSGGTAKIALRVEGGYIQYTVNGKTWTNLIAIADLKGDKGDPGEKGAPGTPGADGITPAIGGNGNWFLGDVDTGMPSRGAGMDLTSATPGQIAKISAVDDNGAPTAWEPVDMPAGGDETWELINTLIVPDNAEETSALTFDADLGGNAFQLKKARLCCAFPPYSGESTIPNFSFSMLNGKTVGSMAPLAYTSVFQALRTASSVGAIWTVDVSGPLMIEEVYRNMNWNNPTDFQSTYYVYGTSSTTGAMYCASTTRAQPITSIGGTQMLIYPGCRFELYGVRA